MRNLTELKQKTLEYCERVRKSGGLTAEYQLGQKTLPDH